MIARPWHICAVLVGLGATSAAAQQATVIFDHAPALPAFSHTKSLRFVYPRSTEEVAGVPGLVEIPTSGELCLKIENANWLLYRYDVKVDTVTAPDIPGLIDLVGPLAALVNARAGGPRTGPPPPPDSTLTSPEFSEYVTQVWAVATATAAITGLKLKSDSILFQEAFSSAETQLSNARSANASADKLWEAHHEAFPAEERHLVRHAQESLMNSAMAVYKEFETASKKAKDPVCAKVGTERLKVVFSVVAAVKPEGGQLARAVANPLVTVEVEPVTTSRVEVVPGLLGGFLSNAQTFSLVNDQIVVDSSDADFFRPGAFLMLRPWSPTWLWATVGLTTGKTITQPDLFMGISVKTNLGGLTKGFSATVGAGYIRTAAVGGLSAGSVGEGLPAGVEDLEKIVKRSYRSAFGILLSVSGIELKQK